MAKPQKEGKLLYHLTALNNLDSIFKNGLLPRKQLDRKEFTNIADDRILEQRCQFKLEEFVPFHFFAGTPFAGAVQKVHSEKDFVYLTLNRISARDNKFKIVPSHPVNYNDKPLEWDKGIKIIDWDLMEKRKYENHECCQCCMAESIYYGDIPSKAFYLIFVPNEKIKDKVVTLGLKYKLEIKVEVNTTFFKKKC